MPAIANHTIHSMHRHYGWDNSLEPVLHVRPGEVIQISCLDAGNGHFRAGSTSADIARMVPGKANPVTGPVYVDGAQPGDMLSIHFLEFQPSGFGWTAILPGFGLLAEEFRHPHLQLWKYDPYGREPALFGDCARIPIHPFAGTVGVAPAREGRHDVIPPRRVGGNLDIRDLVAGTTLHLPVEVAGALLSIGDTHAAQGDGEVCGTAIESAMNVVISIGLEKARAPAFPRLTLPENRAAPMRDGTIAVTTGIGPDLMQAARDAVREMIDLLTAHASISPEMAYMLCSVAGDLRIAEIVDAPNWVVTFHFPLRLFD